MEIGPKEEMDLTARNRLGAFKDYLRVRDIPNRPKGYFKYMSARVAKIVLVTQKLRWSSPSLFNDPFDVQRRFDLGFDDEELRESLVREVEGLIRCTEVPDLSHNPRVQWFVDTLRKDDCARQREIILRELPALIGKGVERGNKQLEAIRRRWSSFLPQFRILCLSAIHDDLLMWSHYGDSHRGVVLEFQPKDDSSCLWVSQPVQYQDSPPIIATKEEWVKSMTGQRSLNTDDWRLYEPLTLTKTTDWKYEEEWRVVSFMRSDELGLFSDYPFNPRELCSVYLGCEISDEDANDVVALLKYDLSHVTAWRASKSERQRTISFSRVER